MPLSVTQSRLLRSVDCVFFSENPNLDRWAGITKEMVAFSYRNSIQVEGDDRDGRRFACRTGKHDQPCSIVFERV
jgi:hypothetical protein